MESPLLYTIIAAACAALITFISTPLVRVLAYRVKALDIPKDDRRMHSDIVPRLGGLAIFFGFVVASVVFGALDKTLQPILIGGLLIVVLGMFDDIYRLKPWIKFIVQIVVAIIPVLYGQTISFINWFGNYVTLGWMEYPLTVIWIVGLTNAINLIDGLDGLSCGVSAICSLSLLLSSIMLFQNATVTLLSAILAGSCLGFLPFNLNPAKIFMGDTGALFLGYTLSVISISGLFKTQAAFSFILPLMIFGLPLFDTIWAIFRRLIHGQSPFHADRGHIHHRLIDAGFNQKQTVYILYAACLLLGISAVMVSLKEWWQALIVIAAGILIFALDYFCFKNPKTKYHTGFFPKAVEDKIDEEILKEENKTGDKK